MKPAFAILAAVLLLAGCAGKGAAALSSGSPRPQLATYASAAFGFSVAYDPSAFQTHAVPRWTRSNEVVGFMGPKASTYKLRVDVLARIVRPRASQSVRQTGYLEIWAYKSRSGNFTPLTARDLDGLRVTEASSPARAKAVKLGDVTAIRSTTQIDGEDEVTYLVFQRGMFYELDLHVPAGVWRSYGPRLDTVAQSFRLTP